MPHFRVAALREVGAWDAWNVTEDADLGIRLARRGYRVGALDSVTMEEAPATLNLWIGQRRRWLKGWMQTLTVHGRNPLELVRDLGLYRALVAAATVAGGVLAALFGPFFAVLLAHDVVTGRLLAPQGLLDAMSDAVALMVFATGLIAMLGPAIVGIRRQKLRGLIAALALLPAYYLLMSWAAWRALFDLACDPHGWIKTAHGLARTSRTGDPPAI